MSPSEIEGAGESVESVDVAIYGSAPETINSDPYGAAWMMKIEMSDLAELNTLMDAAAYEKYCQEREH